MSALVLSMGSGGLEHCEIVSMQYLMVSGPPCRLIGFVRAADVSNTLWSGVPVEAAVPMEDLL